MAQAAVVISLPSLSYQLQHQSENRSGGIKIVLIIGIVISTVAVALRLTSRRLARAALWADDWIILLGLLFTYGTFFILGFSLWQGTLGVHEVTVPLTDAVRSQKLLYCFLIIYSAAYPLIKISVLLLFHRVFVVPRFQLFVKFWIGFVIAQAIAAIGTCVFFCVPVSGFWDSSVQAHCVSQKVVISGIFLLGSLVFIATVFRIVAFFQLDNDDQSWTFVNTAYWTITEMSLGILCACLPTMRPLFRKLFQGMSISTGEQGNKRALRVYNGNGRWVSIREITGTSTATVPSGGSLPSKSVTSSATKDASDSSESTQLGIGQMQTRDLEQGEYAPRELHLLEKD
ncbi:MAG: hypothetical protein M1838_002150 [Thelocarpon superellum]|nr:MAG: hypothetical protein M1838_002150 [Thelocarpon superellum]